MGRKAKRDWSACNAGLKRQGPLTLLIAPEVVGDWSGTREGRRPGGVRRYGDAVIEACLLVRERFGLALRQTEGLVRSLLDLMNLPRPVPDYTTLSRRAGRLRVRLRNMAARLGPGAVIAVDATGLSVDPQPGWRRTKHGTPRGGPRRAAAGRPASSSAGASCLS